MSKRFLHKNTLITVALVVVLLCLCITIGYAMMYDGYLVNISSKTFADNGVEYGMENAPFTYCRVSYIPLEDCLKHAGFGFGWDSAQGMFTVSDNQTTFKLKSESCTVLKNDESITLAMPIKQKDGVYYVPVEFFEKVMQKKMVVQGRIKNKYRDKLVLIPHGSYCFINSTKVSLAEEAMSRNGETFVPAEALLKAMGFTVGWDTEENGLAVYRNGVRTIIRDGTQDLKVDADKSVSGFLFHNIMYVSVTALQALTDMDIQVEGTLTECPLLKRDLLENVTVSNDYRLNGTPQFYNNCYVIGNTAMEILSIGNSEAKLYAGVVNALAEAVPNAQTYSILVPNAAEFYAPTSKYPNQTAGIRTAYANLDERVVPINVVQPLADHAGEKLYFGTDHHWTQRGAYYAYRALNDYRGWKTPDLSEFQTAHTTGFVGSFAGFMSGTSGAAVCRANPDLLERFLPMTEVSGMAYKDMKLTKSDGRVYAIDNRYNTYMTFISGDHPISKFTTSNKNGKSVLIIKESYGNAFATWAMNDYETVYVLDPRKFNGFAGFTERFNLVDFYNQNPFDDLIIINYPGGTTSSMRQVILKLIEA